MLMTAEQRFDRARDMATAAGGENQTEAEFTAAYAAAEKVLNLSTGFDIRFYNSKADGEQVTLCDPVDADTISLYSLEADGHSEWLCDHPMTTYGAEQLAARIHAEIICVLQGLNLGAKIAGAKC